MQRWTASHALRLCLHSRRLEIFKFSVRIVLNYSTDHLARRKESHAKHVVNSSQPDLPNNTTRRKTQNVINQTLLEDRGGHRLPNNCSPFNNWSNNCLRSNNCLSLRSRSDENSKDKISNLNDYVMKEALA